MTLSVVDKSATHRIQKVTHAGTTIRYQVVPHDFKGEDHTKVILFDTLKEARDYAGCAPASTPKTPSRKHFGLKNTGKKAK
jgi:hypothetical protein